MAENDTFVIVGVDTHKKTHVVAIISETGQRMASWRFDAGAQGYRQTLEQIYKYGRPLRAGIEATGSYGAGLCEFLREHGIMCLDVYAPNRQERRRKGKDDTADAYQAAFAALSYERCAIAKQRDGDVKAAQLLETTYSQAVKQRTASINALKAALVSLDGPLRERLEKLSTTELVRTCAAFRISKGDLGHEAGVRTALRALASRIRSLDKEISSLHKDIERFALKLVPATMALFGIGCHGAIRLLCAAGQNIDRMKSEAAFSMLCGASPVPASTGDVYHNRLNRGGDRKANCVLYFMAITRMRNCARTQDFIEKKMSEGKSKKDAIRALKRYLARTVFNTLTQDLQVLGLA
jgi:transposase